MKIIIVESDVSKAEIELLKKSVEDKTGEKVEIVCKEGDTVEIPDFGSTIYPIGIDYHYYNSDEILLELKKIKSEERLKKEAVFHESPKINPKPYNKGKNLSKFVQFRNNRRFNQNDTRKNKR